MSLSLLSALWGAIILVVSTVYQVFYLNWWAKKQEEEIEHAGGPDEVEKNLALYTQKKSKLGLATKITFGLLIISYLLSIYDAATDTKEKRLKAIESQVDDLKCLVGERR
jgi:hypothetical protein